MKRLNRVSFCSSLRARSSASVAGWLGAGFCRHRPCRRDLRRRAEGSEKRRRGAGAGEAGQACGEIDLAPFRMPPLRLKLGEARKHRIDEAADALGRSRDRSWLWPRAAPCRWRRCRSRRPPGSDWDSPRQEAGSADRPLRADAPKDTGKRWMPALAGMAATSGDGLPPTITTAEIAPCLSCSMADGGVEFHRLDLDAERLEQSGGGHGRGRPGGAEIHLLAGQPGDAGDIGAGQHVDLLRGEPCHELELVVAGRVAWPRPRPARRSRRRRYRHADRRAGARDCRRRHRPASGRRADSRSAGTG